MAIAIAGFLKFWKSHISFFSTKVHFITALRLWLVSRDVNIAVHISSNVDVLHWFYHLSVIPVFTNSCINPFIYAAKYGVFQKGVRRMMARLSGRAQEIQPQQNIDGIQMVSSPIQQEALDTGVT